MRNAVDYLHSSENVVYTAWRKVFAWFPVKTVANKRIWLQFVYRRERKLLADIPQFPVKALDKTQYATWDEIAIRKLKGLS